MKRQQIQFQPDQVENVKAFMRELWSADIPESHGHFARIWAIRMRRESAPEMSLDLYLESMDKRYKGTLQLGDPQSRRICLGIRDVYLPSDALTEYFGIYECQFNEGSYKKVGDLYQAAFHVSLDC